MPKMSHKMPLSWYEDHAAEIIFNEDGSVTFVFDEPNDPITGRPVTSRSTIDKESYEAARANPQILV